MTEVGGLPLSQALRLSGVLRRCGEGADSMEAAAERVLDEIAAAFRGEEADGPFALLRLYRTMLLAELEPDLRAIADPRDELAPETLVLVLLASRGREHSWNDRRRSVDHRAIPLRSTEALTRSPMIAGLFEQFEATALVEGEIDELEQRAAFNVFHVPEAAGSPLVPAQDFVERYGIRSVLGFGGFLPPRHLFATILFSTEPIEAEAAELFAPLGLSVKLALLDRVQQQVFA